jgi:hypothetical protein
MFQGIFTAFGGETEYHLRYKGQHQSMRVHRHCGRNGQMSRLLWF